MEIFLNETHREFAANNNGYPFNQSAIDAAKEIAQNSGKPVLVHVSCSNGCVKHVENNDSAVIGRIPRNRTENLEAGFAYAGYHSDYGINTLVKL